MCVCVCFCCDILSGAQLSEELFVSQKPTLSFSLGQRSFLCWTHALSNLPHPTSARSIKGLCFCFFGLLEAASQYFHSFSCRSRRRLNSMSSTMQCCSRQTTDHNVWPQSGVLCWKCSRSSPSTNTSQAGGFPCVGVLCVCFIVC